MIMLDLETLATTPDAVIVSIGAVQFNDDGITARFHMPCNIVGTGRRIDDSTVKWWMGQSDEARKVFNDPVAGELSEVLTQFLNWAGPDQPIWGNGADFDNAIMMNACKFYGYDWSYKRNRCYRTLKSLAPHITLQRVGTYHNAVDDAESQAKHLLAIAKELNIKLI